MPGPRQRVYSPDARRFRDLRLLKLLSHGYTAKQAGKEVGLSEGYVNTRIYALRQEFDAKNIVHLCCRAIREGVIE